MEHVLSVEEMQDHFAEWACKIIETKEPVIVAQADHSEIVLLPRSTFEELKLSKKQKNRQTALQRARKLRAKINTRRGGKPIPPPEDIMHKLREERDEHLISLY